VIHTVADTSLDLAVLRELVTAQLPESNRIDYKLELPSASDSDARDFLFDLASFANSSGGDILFGIKERVDQDGKHTGIPESIEGIDSRLFDAAILRLESLANSCISPRIAGMRFVTVEVDGQHQVLILRIPASWASPHMVSHSGVTRFYGRGERGKYLMSVEQIRRAFLDSARPEEVLREFVRERLAQIDAGEFPMQLRGNVRVVLHCLPFSRAFPRNSNIIMADAPANRVNLIPLNQDGCDHRFNLDGYLSYTYFDSDRDIASGYAQAFRLGGVESVDVRLLSGNGSEGRIPSVVFVRAICESVLKYAKFIRSLGDPSPILVVITLRGLIGMTLAVQPGIVTRPYDRRDYVLPEIVLEGTPTSNTEVFDLMKPAFDALWQGAGLPECKLG
jgi:hypothetical protein